MTIVSSIVIFNYFLDFIMPRLYNISLNVEKELKMKTASGKLNDWLESVLTGQANIGKVFTDTDVVLSYGGASVTVADIKEVIAAADDFAVEQFK